MNIQLIQVQILRETHPLKTTFHSDGEFVKQFFVSLTFNCSFSGSHKCSVQADLLSQEIVYLACDI